MFEELIARIPGGYTLGPWRADADDHIAEPGGQDVALVGRFTDDPCADANAALIALAPEIATALIAAQAEIDRLREAMHRIKDWSGAYPPDVFTPLSDDEEKAAVDAMQAAVSNGSDRMHASWARHLMEGVGEIARAALAPKE